LQLWFPLEVEVVFLILINKRSEYIELMIINIMNLLSLDENYIDQIDDIINELILKYLQRNQKRKEIDFEQCIIQIDVFLRGIGWIEL
jgi:hypothetical protein